MLNLGFNVLSRIHITTFLWKKLFYLETKYILLYLRLKLIASSYGKNWKIHINLSSYLKQRNEYIYIYNIWMIPYAPEIESKT